MLQIMTDLLALVAMMTIWMWVRKEYRKVNRSWRWMNRTTLTVAYLFAFQIILNIVYLLGGLKPNTYYRLGINSLLLTLDVAVGFLFMFTTNFVTVYVKWYLGFSPVIACILMKLAHLRLTQVYYHETTDKIQISTLLYLSEIGAAVLIINMLVICWRHRRRLGLEYLNAAFTALGFMVMAIIGSVITGYASLTNMAMALSVILITLSAYKNAVDVNERTGCYGRKTFLNAVSEDLVLLPDKQFYMVRLNISDFQRFNEKYGTDYGDMVLREFGIYLHKRYVQSKTGEVGYLSADDYVLLITEEAFHEVRPEELVSVKLQVGEWIESFVLKAGICKITDRNMDTTRMLDHASYALEQIHKDYHLNHAVFDGEIEHRYEMENYIQREMKNALDNNHFKVYYQPIVDSATGKVVSAEALVRWQDPVYGLVAPVDFVPLFEKNGFIYDMDRYVWKTVCENISEWKRVGIEVPPISLNVSRVDLTMDDLEESLFDLLINYNLTLQDIKLEITEGAFQLEDGERALRRVEKLHDEGFMILMDDFGSGYSNFNTFKKLPVDVLKADMKFLERGGDTKKGDIIIRSIVDMTKRLQIPMVVEGVETLEDVNYLSKLNCEMFQGFYFFKPLERNAFEEVLRKNNQ